ncbi:peptidoglycan editing factor PgeF [Vibrio rhizosphaerae]|uniref:Purine nucleoside phosphorylase n=1 Tax=Vibrio rhizosphaerae TaxID=398736 RepID=A0ABU4IRK1_9VIBR|nr:peptidoglycan editing factor PgeF [Vibrio rhizosphaerae]MDW6092026.1 peptidoglycan editing factor PgeF [Vibrio rhizosphaerae]
MIIPDWQLPQNVRAVSSTRQRGVSTGAYQSLNLGMHVGDSPEHVATNRQRVMTYAEMPSAPVWMNQTHSTQVLNIDHPTTDIIEADGIFTRTPGVVCAVMTADCLPILMTNTSGTEVAAVHAGWRGLAGGILEQAVSYFSGDVMVWLGPAIGKAAFEVGDDVVTAFTRGDPMAEQAFEPRQQAGKWSADLVRLAQQRLHRVGVTQVSASGLCTYSDAHNFFSFRRDGVTGRQASFIWIK